MYEAVKSGVDGYVVGSSSCEPMALKNKDKLNKRDLVLGKMCLFYKDGSLEPRYEEYDYPLYIVAEYKKVTIVKINLDNKIVYTTLKNRNMNYAKAIFNSLAEAKEYIDSYDKYSARDKRWFLGN